ncbi:hypothetical protein APW68_15680 (plasmid) [Staphylococcus aureus]|nr:hypothetical protein APW68_15680 [Staphylococcus aureus]
MNKDTVLDKGYVIATILNVFFLLGLIFISHFENLYILILYVILMGIKYTGIECIYELYKKNRRSLQIYGFSPCRVISIMLAS